MKKYPCPSCGAEVRFQSSASVFAVCQYCKSTLVRRDLNLEALGKMADLQDDVSPLQIGTTGRFRGEFILLGRVKVKYEDGFWNEWFVRFDDGREGWLAEAQGFLMLSLPVEVPPNLPAATAIHPGLVVPIGKTEFTVQDVKKVTYAFAEGELPFPAPQGFQGVSIDLAAGSDDFASLSYGDKGDVDVFRGQYIEFADLHLQNLKAIDGW